MRYDEHDGQWLAGEAAGSGRITGWQAGAEVWAVRAAGSVLAAGDDVDEDDEDEDDEDDEDEDEDDETEGVAGDEDEDDEDEDDEDDEEDQPDVD